jgi:hypothetical protein
LFGFTGFEGDLVLSNGYAALMELNYYSDYRTEYIQQFSSGLVDEENPNSFSFYPSIRT